MSNPTNPLRQVHNALWTLLEANSEFTTEVEEGNRIKLNDTDLHPWKDEASNADFPEVRVVTTGVTGPSQQTSNGSFMTARYEVQVATGDQGQYNLLDVLWAIYEALTPWEATLNALTWNDKQFVWFMRVEEAKLTEDDPKANRGIKGWSCAWRGYVEMHFTTTDLGT